MQVVQVMQQLAGPFGQIAPLPTVTVAEGIQADTG